MAMARGNAACTTGLSARIYNAVVADPTAGLPAAPSAAQTDALKALCFAIAGAVYDEITLNAVANNGGALYPIQ